MIHAQDIHGQTLQTIGQLARNWVAVVATDLLEICELRHFHTVTPHFPAQSPSPQSRAFPIVFDKADVMQGHINANGFETAQIELLQIRRAGFDEHLILVIMLQAVWIFSIAAIGWTARWLHIGRSPGLRTQSPQRGGRVKRASTHLHIIGLQNGAALLGPVGLKAQNNLLE